MARDGNDYMLPMDANPLAKAIGRRLQLVVDGRELSTRQAAEQMGVHYVRLGYLLRGAQVPSEAESLRIAGWLYEGKDYTKDPLPRTPAKVRKGKGWRRVHTSLDPVTLERATRASKRLGIGLQSLIAMAVERLLDHEPVISTFEEAARRLNRARIVEYLSGDEGMRIILEGDIELALQMGGEMRASPGRKPVMQSHVLLDKKPEGVENFLGEDEWEVLE